jgi:peptide/nickel transport system substrate-binding protein
MKLKWFALSVALAALATVSDASLARDLVMGSSTEPGSIDPQFSRTGNNQNLAMEIFDRLVKPDENLQLHPALAESWKNTDPTTWTINLRKGVEFHDGSPFSADDVMFSFNRAKSVPNSPAPFTDLVGAIDTMRAIDPTTLEIKTKSPTPELIEQIGLVYIVSKKAAEGKATEDFNKGTAAIGTGPFKFKAWVPGERIELERNDKYWGKKSDFEKVTIRKIASAPARVVAIRTGAVDVVDSIPPNDVKALSALKEIKLSSIASGRIVYLGIDASRDESPFVVGADGQPLKPNALKKQEVRTALSKMIDRKAIAERMLDGAAEPAGQMVPEGIGGYNQALPAPAQDMAGARKMLADAGYPQGFGLTIHTSNDRFAGDSQVAQALGQMFTQGGIKVNGVVAQPYNIYAPNASKQMFSAFIFTYGTLTPTSSIALKAVLMTNNSAEGTGSLNRTRYSSAAFDNKMKEAMAEFDPPKRNQLLADATKIAMDDVALIPIFWPVNYWASKADISFTANRGEDFGPSHAHLAK